MPECVVIADDLTGGNATGVLLTRMGLSAGTVLAASRDEGGWREYECVICPTNSRALSAAEAYRRVSAAAKSWQGTPVRLYAKRNAGAEIDALLDVLGDDYAAAITPAFPDSGRTVSGGILSVHGVLLAESEAAHDPLNPVHTSRVDQLLAAQSERKSAVLVKTAPYFHPGLLAGEIARLYRQGIRLFCFDAATNADLTLIAEQMTISGIPFITADPGPLSAAATAALGLKAKARPAAAAPPSSSAPSSFLPKRGKDSGAGAPGCILAVVGSVNEVARRQFDTFIQTYRPEPVFLPTASLLAGDGSRERAVMAAADVLGRQLDAGASLLTLAGDGIYPHGRIDLGALAKDRGCQRHVLSEQINAAFAAVLTRLFASGRTVSGLYLSGGDITLALSRALGAQAIALMDEIVPLAALGRIRGGRQDGCLLASKGGMVGAPDAMCACIARLQKELGIKSLAGAG